METNFFEEDIRHTFEAEFLNGQISVIGDSQYFFDILNKRFPTSGSKIDWKKVVGSVEKIGNVKYLVADDCVAFFNEIIKSFNLQGSVIYIGDSATDFAIRGDVSMMRKMLPELISIPQHHYFVNEDCSWCINYTMEGDMAFGIACSQ